MKRTARVFATTMTLVAVALCALLAGGCSDEGTAEVKAMRAHNEQAAQAYFNEKYQTNASVVESEFIYDYSLFATRSDDMLITMSDGSIVYFDSGDQILYDNRQAKEIVSALDAYLEAEFNACEKALVKAGYTAADARFDYDNVPAKITRGSNLTADEVRPYNRLVDSRSVNVEYMTSYFHGYYNGDIDEFLRTDGENIELANSVTIWITDDSGQLGIAEEGVPDPAWKPAVNRVASVVANTGRARGTSPMLVEVHDSAYSFIFSSSRSLVGYYSLPNDDKAPLPSDIGDLCTPIWYLDLGEGLSVSANWNSWSAPGIALQPGDIQLVAVDVSAEDLEQLNAEASSTNNEESSQEKSNVLHEKTPLNTSSSSSSESAQKATGTTEVTVEGQVYREVLSDRLVAEIPNGEDSLSLRVYYFPDHYSSNAPYAVLVDSVDEQGTITPMDNSSGNWTWLGQPHKIVWETQGTGDLELYPQYETLLFIGTVDRTDD